MIPAALTDTSIELFVQDDRIHAVTEGKVYGWDEMPPRVREAIENDLQQNPRALDLLQDLRPEERLRVYAGCKFGGFNAIPDIAPDGTAEHEHWECGCTSCPLRPLYRDTLEVENGKLTKREIEITRMIARGYLGKRISRELGIAESTINTHKRSIFSKVGVESSVDLAVWATEINLL